jgi:hypothetical protein
MVWRVAVWMRNGHQLTQWLAMDGQNVLDRPVVHAKHILMLAEGTGQFAGFQEFTPFEELASEPSDGHRPLRIT